MKRYQANLSIGIITCHEGCFIRFFLPAMQDKKGKKTKQRKCLKYSSVICLTKFNKFNGTRGRSCANRDHYFVSRICFASSSDKSTSCPLCCRSGDSLSSYQRQHYGMKISPYIILEISPETFHSVRNSELRSIWKQ